MEGASQKMSSFEEGRDEGRRKIRQVKGGLP